MKQEVIQKSKSQRKKNTMSAYDEFKEFEGRKYTGMKIGRSHKWYYDKGEWREKKIVSISFDFSSPHNIFLCEIIIR